MATIGTVFSKIFPFLAKNSEEEAAKVVAQAKVTHILSSGGTDKQALDAYNKIINDNLAKQPAWRRLAVQATRWGAGLGAVFFGLGQIPDHSQAMHNVNQLYQQKPHGFFGPVGWLVDEFTADVGGFQPKIPESKSTSLSPEEIAKLDPNSPSDMSKLINSALNDPSLQPKKDETSAQLAARIQQRLVAQTAIINAQGKIREGQLTAGPMAEWQIRQKLFEYFNNDPLIANKILYQGYRPSLAEYQAAFHAGFDEIPAEHAKLIIPQSGDSFANQQGALRLVDDIINKRRTTAAILANLGISGATEAEADVRRAEYRAEAFQRDYQIGNRADIQMEAVVGVLSKRAQSSIALYEVDPNSETAEFMRTRNGMPFGQHWNLRDFGKDPPSYKSLQDVPAFKDALTKDPIQLGAGVKIEPFKYTHRDGVPWGEDKNGNVIVEVLAREPNGKIHAGFISEATYNALGFPPLNIRDSQGHHQFYTDPQDNEALNPKIPGDPGASNDRTDPHDSSKATKLAANDAGGPGAGPGSGPGAGPGSGPGAGPGSGPSAGSGGAPGGGTGGSHTPAGNNWAATAAEAGIGLAAIWGLKKYGGRVVVGSLKHWKPFAAAAAALTLATGGSAQAATESAASVIPFAQSAIDITKGDMGGAATNGALDAGFLWAAPKVLTMAKGMLGFGSSGATSVAAGTATEAAVVTTATAATGETAAVAATTAVAAEVGMGGALATEAAVTAAAAPETLGLAIPVGIAIMGLTALGIAGFNWWNKSKSNQLSTAHAPQYGLLPKPTDMAAGHVGAGAGAGRPGMHGPAFAGLGF